MRTTDVTDINHDVLFSDSYRGGLHGSKSARKIRNSAIWDDHSAFCRKMRRNANDISGAEAVEMFRSVNDQALRVTLLTNRYC